jgi:hypothetical protein
MSGDLSKLKVVYLADELIRSVQKQLTVLRHPKPAA